MSSAAVAAVIGGAATILSGFGLSDVAAIVQNPLIGMGIQSIVALISGAIAGHLHGKATAK